MNIKFEIFLRKTISYFPYYLNSTYRLIHRSGIFNSYRIALGLLLISQLVLNSCTDKKKESLMVAVSANAQFAVRTIADEYEKEKGVQIEIISSSSGKLAAQIVQGAPYDLFISADLQYPEYVHEKVKGSQSPKVYTKGSLVLWSSSLKEKVTLDLLKSNKVDKIAIANPETAPYGKASIEVLKKLKLYKELKDKLVYGESISQCTQFIQSGAAQIGFTARSIMYSSLMSNEKNWIDIDTALHAPIRQAFLVIKPNTTSNEFSDYVISESGQKILLEFGYFRPE